MNLSSRPSSHEQGDSSQGFSPGNTARLIERDLAVLWHPCSQMRDYREFAPVHVTGAKGTRIHLADGRTLLDAISSWWCKSLGHGHPRLQDAVIKQMQQFEHVILANTTHEAVVGLCEKLCLLANGSQRGLAHGQFPSGLAVASNHGQYSKVFLAGDGSMGMEIAIKMAIQAQSQRGKPQRRRLAHFENGYHGETIGTLSVGDCGLYADPFRGLMFESVCVRGLAYRSGSEDPRWMDCEEEWRDIERQLEPVADQLAAIVYEPVLQGAGGMRLYSPMLLNYLRAWADEHDVFLIADEIASGMYRLGQPLASHLAVMQGKDQDKKLTGNSGSRDYAMADMVVLSKGLTAGFMPLSAVLTTQAIYDLFDADYLEYKAFLHSNTYCGHALAVAVANTVLEVMKEEQIPEQVAAHGPMLLEGLRNLSSQYGCLKNLRGCGMMAAADICRPDGSDFEASTRIGWHVYRAAVERGALLRNLGNSMYLFPPLNTSAEEIEEMLDILGQSLACVVLDHKK